MDFRTLYPLLFLQAALWGAPFVFEEQTLKIDQSFAANGYMMKHSTLVAWGERLLWRRLPKGEFRLTAGFERALSEGGCLTDVNGDGLPDLVLNETGTPALIWLEAPHWRRHRIASGVDAADIIPAEFFGRRGVVLIHKRMQVRFYEIPRDPAAPWPSRDLYSVYTPSRQGGLQLADIDGDGRIDILCGNYWIRAPERFELPWRLFAINEWTGEEDSGMMRLLYRKGRLVAAQRAMDHAWLAWFERPADPREQWKEHRIGGALARPNSVAEADFDGDGRPDLMVAENGGAGRLIVFRARADGGYEEGQVIETGAPAAFASASDLDGDGRPDLVVVRGGFISWWRNRTAPPQARRTRGAAPR